MGNWDYNYLFPIRCYLDSEGHETDKKLRFVDMAIEVDSHIPHWNEKDSEGNWVVDKDREFNLIYSLCFMLASKKKMFVNLSDYDNFAYFVAFDTYKRLTSPRDPDSKPIKSILNYLKSILNWRKIQYQSYSFQKIIDPEYNPSWNDDAYFESVAQSFEKNNRDQLISGVFDTLNQVPKMVQDTIPRRMGESVRSRVYTSVVLSLINKFTLSSQKKKYLNSKISRSTNFDSSPLYVRNGNIILWNLDSSYEDVVTVCVNKVCFTLAEEIKSLSNDFSITADDVNMLLASAFDGFDGVDDERH